MTEKFNNDFKQAMRSVVEANHSVISPHQRAQTKLHLSHPLSAHRPLQPARAYRNEIINRLHSTAKPPQFDPVPTVALT